jgi:hypothetical protein
MKVLSGLTVPQGTVKTGPGSRDQYGLSGLQQAQATVGFVNSALSGKFGDIMKTAIEKLNAGDPSAIKAMTDEQINSIYGGMTREEREVAAEMFEY